MNAKIHITDDQLNRIFESDSEQYEKGRKALHLLKQGAISGDRFLRLISNYKGQSLNKFTRHCAEVANARLRSGWAAVNAREVAL